VRVVKVDMESTKIDFVLHEEAAEPGRQAAPKAAKKPVREKKHRG